VGFWTLRLRFIFRWPSRLLDAAFDDIFAAAEDTNAGVVHEISKSLTAVSTALSRWCNRRAQRFSGSSTNSVKLTVKQVFSAVMADVDNQHSDKKLLFRRHGHTPVHTG
jgi:hypothetical protein